MVLVVLPSKRNSHALFKTDEYVHIMPEENTANDIELILRGTRMPHFEPMTQISHHTIELYKIPFKYFSLQVNLTS